MLEKLIAFLVEKGFITQEKKDELTNALKTSNLKLETQLPPSQIMVDTSKFPPELKQTIDALVNMVNTLQQQNKDLINTLAAEKKAREDAIKAQQEAAEKARKAKIDDLIKKAFGDEKNKTPGKLPVAKKEWFQKFAEKDIEAAEVFLNEYPGDPHLKAKTDSKDQSYTDKTTHNPFTSPGVSNPALLKAIEEQTATKEEGE